MEWKREMAWLTVHILSEDDALMPSVDSENFLWMSTSINAILSFSNPVVHLMRWPRTLSVGPP